MACPVNSPAFHALVFLIGLIIVLGRYVKGAEVSSAAQLSSAALPLVLAAAHAPSVAL